MPGLLFIFMNGSPLANYWVRRTSSTWPLDYRSRVCWFDHAARLWAEGRMVRPIAD